MHYGSISMKCSVPELIEFIGRSTNHDPAFILPYHMVRGFAVNKLGELEVRFWKVEDVLDLKNGAPHDPRLAHERFVILRL